MNLPGWIENGPQLIPRDRVIEYIREIEGRWRANEMDRTPIVGWVWCSAHERCLPVMHWSLGNGSYGSECPGDHLSLYTGTWTAPRLIEAENLIRELVDDGPCHYDHHGYCQGHSLGEYPCPHTRAKQLLGMPVERAEDDEGFTEQ